MKESDKYLQILPEGRTPDVWDKIMCLPGLRLLNPFFQKHRKVLMYLFFGAVTTVISLGLQFTLIPLFESFAEDGSNAQKWLAQIAKLIAWVITVLAAFLTNRVWVFDAETDSAAAYIRQLVSFYGSRVATYIVEAVAMYVFYQVLEYNFYVVTVVTSIVVVILNYVFSKLFVFAKKKDTPTPNQD